MTLAHPVSLRRAFRAVLAPGGLLPRALLALGLAGLWAMQGAQAQQASAMGPLDLALVAVLPTSRAATIDHPTTFFASAVNAGAETLHDCRLVVVSAHALDFSFEQADRSTNVSLGHRDEPFTLASGQVRAFIGNLTGRELIEQPVTLPVSLDCAEEGTPTVFPGVSTLTFRATATAGPDIIAIPAYGPDGIVRIPDGGSGAAVMGSAIYNLGVADRIFVSVSTAYSLAPAPGAENLPLTLLICETDSAGFCLQTPAPSVTVDIGSHEPRSYGIFIIGQGQAIPLDPANNRIFIEVRDAEGLLLAATSAAVTTVE